MIVGFGGTIRTTSDAGNHWHDPTSTLARLALFAVRFTDAGHGVAVGEGGTVIRTDDGGKLWDQRSSGTDARLYSAAFPTQDFAIAVGGDRLANTPAVVGSVDGGRTWSNLASFDFPTTVLESVDCTSAKTCTAVGRCGLIIRTEDAGLHWSEAQAADCANQAWLRSVRFRDASAGLAAGGNTILRTEDGGVSWTRVASPTTQAALAVAYADDLHAVIAAGGDVGEGAFLASDDGGRNWHVQQEQFVDSPIGIGFEDACHGAAVGLFGSIFATDDGGASWYIADETVEGTLYDIALPGQGRRLAVGAMLGNATIRVYDDRVFDDSFDR